MANTNYPQELIALLEEYLTDGIISAKERQVLLNKAISLGVNADEFDLYIDAQQQKADQVVDAAVSKKRGATCPFCGGSVPPLTDKCPHCGQFITAEAGAELQEILDNLEEALIDFKSGKNIEKSKATVERYARKARLFYSSNPKIKILLAEVDAEVSNVEKQAVVNKTIKNKWFWQGSGCAINILVFLLVAILDAFGAKNAAEIFLFFAIILMFVNFISIIVILVRNIVLLVTRK